MFHIIDDEEFVREVIVEFLEVDGHKVISFGSPTEYIKFINGTDFQKPIAVFTDVNMPEMNGYLLINEVSKLVSGMKFVVMTGEAEIRSEHANKACMFLTKPFVIDNVRKVVGRLIRCHASSPADEQGCASVDNREVFPIENWSCPHACNDFSSESS